MSYFTLSSGEQLYYEDKGHGPETIVMMHGWTSSHEIFLKPVEGFRSRTSRFWGGLWVLALCSAMSGSMAAIA